MTVNSYEAEIGAIRGYRERLERRYRIGDVPRKARCWAPFVIVSMHNVERHPDNPAFRTFLALDLAAYEAALSEG
jgi:hypothetical protein